MAKISEMPSPEAIMAFKGTLDFYKWRGLNVVRAWPRPPSGPRAPAVQAAAQTFSAIIKAQPTWASVIRDAAEAQTKATAWTWRDELVSSNYGVLWHPSEESTVSVTLAYFRVPQTTGLVTIPINNTTFFTVAETAFQAQLTEVSYNAYRIVMFAQSTQAGQTVQAQLTPDGVPSSPIGPAPPDLTISNSLAWHDTGWLALTPAANPDGRYALAFRGSNSTVDLNYAMIEVLLRQP